MSKIPQKLERKNLKYIKMRLLPSSVKESRTIPQWAEK